MSGGATAVWVSAAAAVAGAAVSYQNGQDQKKAAERSAQQAQANALKQEKAADEANNRANQKRANTAGILDAAMQSGKAGASGTMLTGPQGIDPNLLNLGKTTLLGS
jgi:Flp pilus assembly protein TadB